MNRLLVSEKINKSFQLENQTINVLRDVSVEIHQAEFVAIMGKSGSGKSTLISILAGLDHPDSGTILLNDTDLTQLNEDQLALKRQTDISFVFQSFHLHGNRTLSFVNFIGCFGKAACVGDGDKSFKQVDIQVGNHFKKSYSSQLLMYYIKYIHLNDQ